MGDEPVDTHLCVGLLSRARTLCDGETRKGYSYGEFQSSRSNCIFNRCGQSEGIAHRLFLDVRSEFCSLFCIITVL
jgi:hypothetical protein